MCFRIASKQQRVSDSKMGIVIFRYENMGPNDRIIKYGKTIEEIESKRTDKLSMKH